MRSKLLELKVYGDALEEIMATLVAEDFLNEERFARAYAGGKFRMKQWGRVRIGKELRYRKVSAYCISKAMEEIPEEAYMKTLQKLFQKARTQYAGGTPAQRHYKVRQFLLRKGYEPALVFSLLRSEGM